MKRLALALSLTLAASAASAQGLLQFRYGGSLIVSASTFASAVVAPAVPGTQNLITHWFAEPVSGTTVSFWASASNTCAPVALSGITSMVIANNSPIMDGAGNGVLFAAPIGDAICAQAAVTAIPGLVTYGVIP